MLLLFVRRAPVTDAEKTVNALATMTEMIFEGQHMADSLVAADGYFTSAVR